MYCVVGMLTIRVHLLEKWHLGMIGVLLHVNGVYHCFHRLLFVYDLSSSSAICIILSHGWRNLTVNWILVGTRCCCRMGTSWYPWYTSSNSDSDLLLVQCTVHYFLLFQQCMWLKMFIHNCFAFRWCPWLSNTIGLSLDNFKHLFWWVIACDVEHVDRIFGWSQKSIVMIGSVHSNKRLLYNFLHLFSCIPLVYQIFIPVCTTEFSILDIFVTLPYHL